MMRDLEAGIKSAVFDMAQGTSENITGKLLDRAASLGDPYALELYRREGYYLGVGLANLCNLLDPEVLVLGGGITKGKEFFHEAMIETLRERSEPEIHDGFLRYSLMNDRVVLYGAFFLVKEFVERE
jgi:glucokinase